MDQSFDEAAAAAARRKVMERALKLRGVTAQVPQQGEHTVTMTQANMTGTSFKQME